MLVTLTGGYLTYDTSWKINTPATGSGNVTVEIEICSAAAAPEHNVRGSYRIYNAAPASQFELLPTNVVSSSYTSGFSSRDDHYFLWGDAGIFTCVFPDISLTASNEMMIDAADFVVSSMTTSLVAATSLAVSTVDMTVAASSSLEIASLSVGISAATELELTTPSIQIQPIAGGTTARTVHPHSHYYGIVYGATGHGYINKVIDGLKVAPASGGLFDGNKIIVTPGRAYVGGKLVTIGLSTTLSNVSNLPTDTPSGYRTALTDGNFFPASSGLSRWYGVWLRSDGSFRVGNMPDMGLHTGIPGSTGYMIPADDVELGYYRHNYTLVDIVWCYDYDSSTAGHIRFAGMTHLGGGLHVYHQARLKDWSTLTPGNFMSHTCLLGVANATNVDYLGRYKTNSLLGVEGISPGIPTDISGAAYLGVYLDYTMDTASSVTVALLHSNATLVPYADESTSQFAPPIAITPTPGGAPPQLTSMLDVEHDDGGPQHYYTYPIWMYKQTAYEASMGSKRVADSVVYPLQRTAAGECGEITVNFLTTGFTAGDAAAFSVTNLGFFWDRYNPGGIY
jgi:hypothetical protein